MHDDDDDDGDGDGDESLMMMRWRSLLLINIEKLTQPSYANDFSTDN